MAKTHYCDHGRSSVLYWTFCGLYSSHPSLPYTMTHNLKEVTCKNCLKGIRKDKYDALLTGGDEQ